MSHVVFITHAEVQIDPGTPVPKWKLSIVGINRHRTFNRSRWADAISSIYCSDEQKAIDGAEILGAHLKLSFEVIHSLHENDRSATGYLAQPEFRTVANEFFDNPHKSIRGWERAIDAQSRIYDAVVRIIERNQSSGDIAIISHGGVGALLLCKLLAVPISRAQGQPGTGGGNFFVFNKQNLSVIQTWIPIDA